MLFADALNAPCRAKEEEDDQELLYREEDIGRYIDGIISTRVSAMGETTHTTATGRKQAKRMNVNSLFFSFFSNKKK
jgi:hypothetical protein